MMIIFVLSHFKNSIVASYVNMILQNYIHLYANFYDRLH